MQLVATSGPLAGTTIALMDGITLPEARGGPPCCRITRSADNGFVLDVLRPQIPVFVNGLPTATHVLEGRDELRIGESVWVARDEAAAPPSSVIPVSVRRDSSASVTPVFEVSFEEALFHRTSDAAGREGQDLATLLRVGAALSAIHGLATIDAALAGLVLEIVPAEHVVFATGDGPTAIQSAWSAAGCGAGAVRIDPRMLDRAAKERVAVSLEIDRRYVIVVPMMAFGRASGSIWVETSRAHRFDQGHVRLLLVVAALAAVARHEADEAARLQHTNELLQAEINLEHNMVGTSLPMRAVFDRIARVARTDATILLRGESGTGKELAARAVHRNSRRAERPFIAINCAAITETLLESELFGHEKGAFTGALGLKKGKLELADGGTLFLDEIGELAAPLQAKLLRAIQEREFERVGGTRPVRVDFRLVVATNRDLEAAVKAGTFRQDLYYRLNVVTLLLPPLRDRMKDLPLLADYFTRKHAAHAGRRVRGLAPGVLARLAAHQWPGNVRELENVIEQAIALGVEDQIVADDLPAGLGDPTAIGQHASSEGASLDYHQTVERTKREVIVRALERAEFSYARAARLLGVHPNYLHRLIRNLGLKSQLESAARRSG
jgi:Nif-specific regulatory protein